MQKVFFLLAVAYLSFIFLVDLFWGVSFQAYVEAVLLGIALTLITIGFKVHFKD